MLAVSRIIPVSYTHLDVYKRQTYYYLSYMGEGLYAARSEDGSVSAVDADVYKRQGCAEQHGVFAQCAAVHACRGEQNGALSHARQRFVHGEHGHIRTFRDRRRQADGREVCTVCTVYEQQRAVRAAQIGKLGNRPPDAVIGRRGQQDCLDLRMRDQL